MTEFLRLGKEILMEILSRLPPKTLMRFKCVSKWWDALITTPDFVAKHLYHSRHSNLPCCILLNRLLLLDNKTDQTDSVFSFLNFVNGNDTDTDNDCGAEHSFGFSVKDIDIPISVSTLKQGGQSLCIVGHCDGIICVKAYSSGEVFLWNPAIQESRQLPPEPYLPNWSNISYGNPPYIPHHGFEDALGFGYDPKLNDYKVICIGFSGSEDYGDNCDVIVYPPKAVAYTLRSDTWREIETDSLETETTNLCPESFQIYFKGMCYWLGKEQSKVINTWDISWTDYIRYVIILFDTSEEVFHDMLLPHSLGERLNLYDMRLLVWDESVALFGFHHVNFDPLDTSFGIWVMDEVGGPSSGWTKHLSFDLSERPLTFWKSDEILLVSPSPNQRILVYNFGTRTSHYLPVQVKSTEYVAVSYKSSIVSVTGQTI